MAELAQSTLTSQNIATPKIVLSYTYTGNDPIEVMARVDLGKTGGLLSGAGGTYELAFLVNGSIISPNSLVPVEIGATSTIMVSRAVPIQTNDLVTLRVTGQAGDTTVHTFASLRDVSPPDENDLTIGDGPVAVNHDYGGADALAYKTAAGVPIDNATVRLYRYIDYVSGDRSAEFILAQTYTDVNGRWRHTAMLDPSSYAIVFFRQTPKSFGPDIVYLTVS